jgi:hypothetical protein
MLTNIDTSTLQLYLGVYITPELQDILKTIPRDIYDIYTQGGDYLQEIHLKDKLFLAKPIGTSTDFPSLELTESNVMSLLKKLFKEASLKNSQLLLFASL